MESAQLDQSGGLDEKADGDNAAWRNLLFATGLAALALDRQLRVKLYTPALEQLFFIKPDDVGRPVTPLLRQLRYDSFSADAADVIANRRPITREVEATAHGWLALRLLPYQLADGSVDGLVITFDDISKRKNAGQDQSDALTRVDEILDCVSDAFYTVDRDWRVTYMNRRTEELWGIKREQALGAVLWDLFPGIGQSSGLILQQQAMQERRALSGDVFSPLLGCWAEVRAFPNANGIAVYVRDISKRKEAEQQAIYQAGLLANVHDAVLAHDEQLRVTYWNNAASELFGWTAEEALGRFSGDFFQTELPGSTREAGIATLLAAGQFDGEALYRRKDGKQIIAHVRSAVLKDSQGNFSGLVSAVRDITAHKEAERALSESEHRYRTLFDTMDQGFCVIERQQNGPDAPVDFRYLATNPAFERHTNLQNVIGKTIRECRDVVNEEAMAVYDRVALTGEPLNADVFVAAIGIWIAAHIFRVGEPQLGRIAILFRNITEQRHAELALRESEQRFRAVFETSLDAIIITDDQMRFIDANPAASDFLPAPHEELLQRSLLDYTPDNTVERVQQMWRDLMSGAMQDGDFAWRAPDGRMRAVEFRVRANFMPGLHIIFSRDVTARWQAEIELREREQQFRSLADNMPDVVARLDHEGRYVFVNHTAERQFSTAPDTLLGKKHIDLDDMGLELAQLWDNSVAEVLRDGQIITFDFSVPESTGPRYYETRLAPEFGVNGEITTVLAITRDITERVQAQEDRQARAVAEAASLEKTRFLSRMSHELRTPLNAMLGFAQLLQMDSADPDQREYIDLILLGGQHLLSLINEVLDIARIEQGYLELQLEPARVDEALRDTLDLSATLAAANSVTVKVEGLLCRETVLADRLRLRQILLNLVSNAIKYNRPGGAVVIGCGALDNEQEPAPAGFLRLWVRDNGIGIAADKLAKLFLPFERLDADAAIEGTGLGLTLTKLLAEAMCGAIGVISVKDQGSTFWVDLPAA